MINLGDLGQHPAALLLTAAAMAYAGSSLVNNLRAAWKNFKRPAKVLKRHDLLSVIMPMAKNLGLATEQLDQLYKTAGRPDRLEVILTYRPASQARQAAALRRYQRRVKADYKLRLVAKGRQFNLVNSLKRYSSGKLIIILTSGGQLEKHFDNKLRLAFLGSQAPLLRLKATGQLEGNLGDGARPLPFVMKHSSPIGWSGLVVRSSQLKLLTANDAVEAKLTDIKYLQPAPAVKHSRLAAVVYGVLLLGVAAVCWLDAPYAILCLGGLALLITLFNAPRIAGMPFVARSDKTALLLLAPVSPVLAVRFK